MKPIKRAGDREEPIQRIGVGRLRVHTSVDTPIFYERPYISDHCVDKGFIFGKPCIPTPEKCVHFGDQGRGVDEVTIVKMVVILRGFNDGTCVLAVDKL